MLYRFLFFTLSFLLLSCSNSVNENNLLYDSLITEYSQLSDFDDLEFIKAYPQNEEVVIISEILKAIDHYNTVDSLNPKSTSLFLKAAESVKNTSNTAFKDWVYSEIGFYYYSFSHYLESEPYFVQVSKTLDSNIQTLTIQKESILTKAAYFFETMGEYAKSRDYYLQVLQMHPDNPTVNGTIYYALGFLSISEKNFSQAEKYFLLSGENSLQSNDSVRYAKSLGGLGMVYANQNKTDLSIEYLLRDISISKTLNEEKNTMYAQIQLGKVYYKLNSFDKARVVFEQAYGIAASKIYLIGFEEEIVRYLINLSIVEKNAESELFYRRELENILALMENKEGDEVIKEINWKVVYDRINGELEIKQNALDQILYQRILLLTTIVLLLIVAYLTYRFSREIIKQQALKYEAKLLNFQLDKIKSENKLKETNKTISSYQVYLTEKTEQIKSIEKELYKLQKSSLGVFKEKKTSIEELIKSHLMTEENWQLFKETFISEQPEYIDYLNEHFPSLTETNLRIVLLQKIGLSNQETANLLGVTIDAVKKAKQRLKKKYEIDFDIILNNDN